MIPKRILLENFLSFGEPAVEIEFTDSEPLWVICGPNGVGKSAIFDAVTYALFASHRGGAKNSEQLIRHGASSFRVEFDFEINGRDYRISRTKASRTTQKVFSRTPGTGEWEPEHIGNSAPDVKRWVESHIGLEFEAFKASVLLRQGEADAILTATGAERLELLKTIIDASRFEHLSDQIHEDVKEYKDELDRLRETLDNVQLVSEEEIAAAQKVLFDAEQRRKELQARSARASELLAGAKHWSTLVGRKSNLERLLGEAKKRAEQANRILADKARLEMLTAIVPKLQTIHELRAKIARSETEHSTLSRQKSDLETKLEASRKAAQTAAQALESCRTQVDANERAAKGLREEIARDNKSLAASEELSKLKEKIATFPTDLTQSLEAAEKELVSLSLEAKQAGELKAATDSLLKQAAARQTEFAKVGVGISCSLCGQIVDAAHAKKEKDKLKRQVTDLQKKNQTEELALKNVENSKQLCEKKRDQLRHWDQQRTLVVEKLRAMEALGVSGDPTEVRRQLEEKNKSAAQHERIREEASGKRKGLTEDKERFDRQCESIQDSLAKIAERIRTIDLANAAENSQWKTLNAQLPLDWQERSKKIERKEIDDLESERIRLEGLGLFDAFEKLQQDSARMHEWTKQLDETILEMEGIAVESRLSVEEVQNQSRSASSELSAVERERDEAKTKLDELNRRRASHRDLVELIRVAERKFDLQKKLDDLLGKKGLQRELVRTAESSIIFYAKDILDKLSDGDLILELAVEEDADTAFELRVRRAEDPVPIAVSFLSGSQKFRVAVSIALAIGRFASGQARPLESVIIDEGFGSLDRDGLRAMADELNRLRTCLRRIVLVSHQEEFADRFPVGIRLSASDHGTIAEHFRR